MSSREVIICQYQKSAFIILSLRFIGAMAFDKPVVVIDNGSYILKAGFACDNHPVSMFRNVVGRPNYLHGSYGKEYYDVHIGLYLIL